MKLAEKDTSFELLITGYEYPNTSFESYDSNWLIIQLSVSTTQGAWKVSDPCLLTYEVKQLANWFDKLNKGYFEETEYSFMERVIAFSVLEINQIKFLHICFYQEALPPWAMGQDEYSINIKLSELDLKSSSEYLQKQLEIYPQRATK